MSTLTQLRVRNAHGALERILGVIRIRGFSVQSLPMQMSQGGQTMDVTLRVESTRPSQFLYQQLEKLHEVESVEMDGKLEMVQSG